MEGGDRHTVGVLSCDRVLECREGGDKHAVGVMGCGRVLYCWKGRG